MKKLLITGASGFLGSNLCQLLRLPSVQVASSSWQVYGTYLYNAAEIPGCNLLRVDITDPQQLQELFGHLQPDAIIHAAACSQPNYCQRHPQESYRVNVTASLHLASLAAESEIPLVFTSTDLVFDGTAAPYGEKDSVSPVSIYGEQKVLAEEGMRARYSRTVICRMPLMFGTAPPHASSFIQSFLKSLRAGKSLSLFSDEFRTPVSGATAARGLLLALEQEEKILHLGGKERLSRYEFGQQMAEVFQLSETLITACLQKDVPMPAPRPQDVSLNSSLAYSLGYQPLSVREELELLRWQL